MKNEMTQHSTELQEVIETQLVGDVSDQSFLTKKEVEQLISVHFNRIEKGLGHLAESIEQQSKKRIFADYCDEMKNLLKECRKYNHPNVITKGIFKDGSNPFKKQYLSIF
ncbi:hypothetical protein ACI2WT_09735 [Lysinibacillus fusiformis]